MSSATDASTAGTARIVAACASGLFLVTRRGRDVIVPKYTEMDVIFNRPASPLGVLEGEAAGRNARPETDRER